MAGKAMPTSGATGRVIRSAEEADAEWLGGVLGIGVTRVARRAAVGNWSNQTVLDVQLEGGATRTLRLKICQGDTFGRSELDYYTRDYLGLPDAPLVTCLHGAFKPGLGYHLLLDDLSATHHDRRDASPTLAHGQALARALGRLHRHHWQTAAAPADAVLQRYLDEARPGLMPMSQAVGLDLAARVARFEREWLARWSRPQGMALMHGDANPTNVLTPHDADVPVLLLDRQPFDWSLTYGVALYDLAYATVPWWPEAMLRDTEDDLLRAWFETVEPGGYAWTEVQADWQLSVAQCLCVPLEWCSKPATLTDMRWLWEMQLRRILAALERHDRS